MGISPGNDGTNPTPPPVPGGPAFQSPPPGQMQAPPPAPEGSSPGFGYGPPPSGYRAPQLEGPPSSVMNAVKLMYVGAALSALTTLSAFFFRDQFREVVEETMADTGSSGMSVDTMVNFSIGSTVVMGVIAVGLWLLMAMFVKRGASWARIVSTVLGALSLGGFVIGMTQPQPTYSTISSLLSVLLAVAILFFLWRPESTRYFEVMSDRRV